MSSGVAEDDIALARLDEIAPVGSAHPATSLIWADVLGQARRNARPVALYLAFATAAGVIAAFGVIEVNTILIVGAMAISPDMLPLSAACVGLVSRRGPLVRRALVTLVVGLSTSCAAATLVAVVLDLTDLMPSDFVLNGSALGGLTTVDAATVGVAFAAGVAGILALETRASSAVGVAISVTTIPAAAYLGVAAGAGEASQAWGALGVLGVNVAVLLTAGTLTLLVQRRWGRSVDEIGDVVQVRELMPEDGQTPEAPASPDVTAILRSRAFVGLLLLAAIVGLVASVAAWGFLELIHQVQVGVWDKLPDLVGYDNGAPLWWAVPVLAIAGALVAVAIVRLPGEGGHVPAEGLKTGVTQPIELPGVLLAAVAGIGLGRRARAGGTAHSARRRPGGSRPTSGQEGCA